MFRNKTLKRKCGEMQDSRKQEPSWKSSTCTEGYLIVCAYAHARIMFFVILELFMGPPKTTGGGGGGSILDSQD